MNVNVITDIKCLDTVGLNYRNKERELRDDQVGWIDLTKDGDHHYGLINVRDRVGGRLWLPCPINPDQQSDLESKLEKLGYQSPKESWVSMELDSETRNKLANASLVLPPLLAVHASMNLEFDLPSQDQILPPIPLIGLEAKPHSGKTLGLIAFMMVNIGAIYGIDFDPFSDQSLDYCFNDVWKEIQKRKIDPRDGFSKIVPIFDEVFQRKKTPQVSAAKEKVNLSTLLDNALFAQINLVNPHRMIACLIDLPGEDQRTEKLDVVHLIRHLIPTINLNRENPEEDPTKIPILDIMNSHRLYTINDILRAELGGYQRWHRPTPEKQAINRAKKDALNFNHSIPSR
ncbi:MAG TPA: hypothetical protein PK639_04275 [Candidatus Woesebacteria bacterium]|nr:hypothetical protein [Candidatus Woesebacteria bacterium]